MDQVEILLAAVVKGLQEKKGHDIVIVDLREMQGAICRYMVICEGNNPHQVSALSDSVWEVAHKEAKEKSLAVHGGRNAQWIGMDYGTVIVHIFMPEIRSFYRLESLWEDSIMTKIPDAY